MSNKKLDCQNEIQLSLFDNQDNHLLKDLIDESIDDFLQNNDLDEFISETEDDSPIEVQELELLTLKLLRQAIQKSNKDDLVMTDFSNIVLPNLLKVAIGETAKGGKFQDALDLKHKLEDAQNIQEGKQPKEHSRRNASDQSLNTHLLNGLFPTYLIKNKLAKLESTIWYDLGDLETRLFVAGFILHDFEKFPDIREKYSISPNNQKVFTVDEQREIILKKLNDLCIDEFMAAQSKINVADYIDDLLFIICNTQKKYGTNLNLSEYGLNPKINPRILVEIADLSCLADLFSSLIKKPQDISAKRFNDLINGLSDGTLGFTYHHLAENRGVLTNVVNNAVMDLYKSVNTDKDTFYKPLLYLPTGVIYLKTKNAPAICMDGLGNQVINKIKQLCCDQIISRNIGISRGNLIITYAPFVKWIFSCKEFIANAPTIIQGIITNSKSSEKLTETYKILNKKDGKDYIFDLSSNDLRVDQLALLVKLLMSVWDDYVNTKKKKDKFGDSTKIIESIINYCKLQNIKSDIQFIKSEKNKNGNPFEIFFFADQYLKRNPGLESVFEICMDISNYILKEFSEPLNELEKEDNLSEIKNWVDSVVNFPENKVLPSHEGFLSELNNYTKAKKRGGKVCSLGGNSISILEQSKDSVLFMPQQFSNRIPLGKTDPKRGISKLMAVELMLRKCLMSNVNATGSDFEDRKYRYLYFYPTYYFTPETNKFLQQAYLKIAQTRFDTELRNHFISKKAEIDLSKDNFQSVDFLLMDEDLQEKQKLPENDPNYKKDRTFKLSYPEDQPLTFYFIALPPGRDPTDTESWVMPAWLAFAMPMILDVKTVVSESPIPPFTDGSEFEETVFLDSAPQAFRVLTGAERFRLDYILEGWKDEQGQLYPAPLKTLTAAYAIHLDVNPKRGKGGYDANWGKLTELAKDIQSNPLHVFSYLSQWRRGKDSESPPISKIQLYAYHFYPCFDPYVTFKPDAQTVFDHLYVTPESPMNHPKELTKRYREFYRANKSFNPKANAVLKPVDEAANVILNADSCLCDEDTLVDLVAARICKLMDRVHSKTAEGRPVVRDSSGKHYDREQERKKVYEFAQYFVLEVFTKGFKGDRARLAGKQMNLIRDTCEFLYRLAQDQENQDRKAEKESQLVEEEE